MSGSFLVAAATRAVDSRPTATRRPPRVLCYGDSLTAGLNALTSHTGAFSPWAPQLADALGVAVDHVGMCGWTTAQMLDGLDGEDNVDVYEKSHRGLRRLLVVGGYSHVLLMAGTNDLKLRSTVEIVESLHQLHAACHAAGARTLALGIPHSKATTVGSVSRCERRRKVNERLRAFAARSGGWCEYCEPGGQVMQWEAGSICFERDGLHLTRSGSALFAALLLRGRALRDFLQRHSAFAPALPKLSEEAVAWRRRMREWIEQYRVAVDTVQDDVFDVHMAEATREELEALHSVLQTEGLAGLRATVKSLEMQALERAFAEGGEEGLRAAEKAAKRAKKAAAKAQHRGETPTAAAIAKLAQAAFVPTVGMDLQRAAQPLRLDPATLCARLDAWRTAPEDREPFGDVETKDAIECFVDSCFTVFTVDNATYHPLTARRAGLLSERRSERLSERYSYPGSDSGEEEEGESDGDGDGDGDGNDDGLGYGGEYGESESESEGEGETLRAHPGSPLRAGIVGPGSLPECPLPDGAVGARSHPGSPLRKDAAGPRPHRTLRAPWWAHNVAVPWLSLPSPQLTSFAVVHRGPRSGGHLKLFLRAAEGSGPVGGAAPLYVVDVMKEASKLHGHDWGDAEPLARASFAYPRSGGMYPTIFRFVPAGEGVDVPAAAAAASELHVSARGHLLAGSGWFALRGGLSVAAALSSFVGLASTRWAHVELYNCRSFVRELAERLAEDETSVTEAFDNVFRFVVLEREMHGDRQRG